MSWLFRLSEGQSGGRITANFVTLDDRLLARKAKEKVQPDTPGVDDGWRTPDWCFFFLWKVDCGLVDVCFNKNPTPYRGVGGCMYRYISCLYLFLWGEGFSWICSQESLVTWMINRMVKFCTFWEVPYPWGFISFEITGMGHTVDGNQKSPRPNNHRLDGWMVLNKTLAKNGG